jgi:hypothetical protein
MKSLWDTLFFPKSTHQNLKSPGKNSGSEPRAVGFNSSIKGLNVDEWSTSNPSCFIPEKKLITHRIGSWVKVWMFWGREKSLVLLRFGPQFIYPTE